ncbi:MAG: protein TolQ [Methyloceanibacter sp.]|jgi:biopolymer transport protein TolQ
MNPSDVPVDLSIFELFMNADIVVKLVIVGLLAISVWSWAIVFEKFVLFAKTRKEADKFEQVFWSGQSLDELYQALAQRRNTGMAALFVAAMREWKRSTEGENGDRGSPPMPGLQLRVVKVMEVAISREVERLERRLTFLATVGSTAPFVGLFGTVWGIMASFQAIGSSNSTTLAAIAPGIAEALFATALGLLAAVPAVIFYNKFNSDAARHAARLEGFADEFSAILSRQIDKTG